MITIGLPDTTKIEWRIAGDRPRAGVEALAEIGSSAPVNLRIAYIRSDDGAEMVEIAPHQTVSLRAALALRLLMTSFDKKGGA